RRRVLRPRPDRHRHGLHAPLPPRTAAPAGEERAGGGSGRVRAVAVAGGRPARGEGVTRGALVLVATPIGNLGDLSPRAVEALAGADVIACEDTRRTRKLLSHAGVRSRKLVAVHDHNEASMVRTLLTQLDAGTRVALVTELTKLHEEVWRGTLAAAAVHLDEREPRGEYVIVLGGAPPAADATQDDVEDALRARLEAGEDKRSAVAAVAAALAVPKR